ncbi:aromatic acid/H+ symport family MFS transporter [Rhodococcus sp. IEGM 1408]|uniref:MFS transporter n=1 Tax=Rhodococcus sp. IEGM 1408 TaxID=3082220 RepID=UPI002953BB78|nr:aromatic acid/H+ symport family MFS transporter [Rhodococcus sp. IEGM 1408]MDV8000726.1 aromatic acid/H+ symport family MFS transporter [Rhodococcus sp. IEGM 1408]
MTEKTAPEVDVWESPAHKRTVYGVLAVVALAILFDGYDLVVYGAILPSLMADPSQIGPLGAAQAGALGSYALVGVMIGALSAGAVGDRLGRRRIMLGAIAWFSIGMAATSFATNITTFGILRLLTGLGIGAIVATGGAIIAEFAPAGKRNLFNAVVYSGIPAGGVLASALAMVLREHIGWRGLFLIGALPILIVLPYAWYALPESPRWLSSRGRTDEAVALCYARGLPTAAFIDPPAAPAADTTADSVATAAAPTGFAGLLTPAYRLGTLLLGFMSFAGLLLTYGLNTWLPTIMESYGINAKSSLGFLLVLNGGAILGGLAASRLADKHGPRVIVACSFVLATLALVAVTLSPPFALMILLVAAAGMGTIGTQVLVYGFVSNYYETGSRAAGVAWCAGFGRLGGILGPVIGGLLVAAGLQAETSFLVFAGVALAGALITLAVPRSPGLVAQVPDTVLGAGRDDQAGGSPEPVKTPGADLR